MMDQFRVQPWGRLGTVLVAALLVFGTAACAEESTTGTDEAGSEDTVAPETATDLLGPEDLASGEPVKVGLLSDGATQSFDNSDEVRAGQATAEFVNQHRGGIAGRPIEIVPCDTAGDPAVGADCANKFITADVVAVAASQSAVTEDVWRPLQTAGIPTFFVQATTKDMATDSATSFMINRPGATFFGLPIAAAKATDAKKVTFVVIDVPQALELLNADGERVMAAAGLDYDVVRVPIGTADMTSQMQQIVAGGSGVVHVIGYDAFCIAAFQGLSAVGYDGAISGLNQCFTDATREALPNGLEGIYAASSLALGADDDPTYQLYLAVMDQYGTDVTDVDNFVPMGGYAAVAGLAEALQGLTGDATPATVAAAIKTMPQSTFPGGGGVQYQCGGSAVPTSPAVCTNQWLLTQLDAAGEPTNYSVEDASTFLD